MVINQIILFSVIISALFVGVFSMSHDSANADIHFFMIKLVKVTIVLTRMKIVRLLIKMTARQKVLAMMKANLIY